MTAAAAGFPAGGAWLAGQPSGADPHTVAAGAVLTGEVYVDYTSLCGGEPARLERRT